MLSHFLYHNNITKSTFPNSNLFDFLRVTKNRQKEANVSMKIKQVFETFQNAQIFYKMRTKLKPFVNQHQPILEVVEAAKILDQNLISFQEGSALHT